MYVILQSTLVEAAWGADRIFLWHLNNCTRYVEIYTQGLNGIVQTIPIWYDIPAKQGEGGTWQILG